VISKKQHSQKHKEDVQDGTVCKKSTSRWDTYWPFEKTSFTSVTEKLFIGIQFLLCIYGETTLQ
jgi:hypothetical protein